MAEGVMRKKGKSGTRKYGRNKGTPKAKRYELKYLTNKGMKGRKIKALMESNNYTREQAEKHWKRNRKRGLRGV